MNAEHRCDVFSRGNPDKIKTLDIEYMRCSLFNDRCVFIGTEEKLCYMVDSSTFEILDRMPCQSYVFTIALIDSRTIVCG